MTFTFWRARQDELMLSRTCDELTNTRSIFLAAGCWLRMETQNGGG